MADVYDLHLHLTSEQIADYRAAFGELDKDGDGIIPSRELFLLLRSLGIACTEMEADRMIKTLEDDGAGTLSFPEFLELMNQKWRPSLLKDPDASRIFRAVADPTGDTVDAGRLATLLGTLGKEPVTDAELGAFMQELGLSDGQSMDLADFTAAI